MKRKFRNLKIKELDLISAKIRLLSFLNMEKLLKEFFLNNE
jgi:hypothetical protein